MEKRLIVAIVLSFVVLVAFQLLFKPAQQPQPAGPAQAPTAAPGAAPTPSAPAAKAPQTAAQPPAQAPAGKPGETVTEAAETDVTIDTSLFTAVWTNRGGNLKSWALKTQKDDQGRPLELVPAAAVESGVLPFHLELADPERTNVLNSSFYRTTGVSTVLRDGGTAEVRFEFADGRGLRVEKVYRLHGGTYEVESDLRVTDNGAPVDARLVWGPGLDNPTAAEMKKRVTSSEGVAVLSGGAVTRIDQREYKPEASSFVNVSWAAYEENYFTALFVLPGGQGSAQFVRRGEGPDVRDYLSVSLPERAYIGPKDYNRLVAFGHDAKKVINFGFFGVVAEALLLAAKFSYRLIPNWGVAIILLTIVIKILFFPLTYSSTKSMAKMQELQPKVKALRAKYKRSRSDIEQRRQMNEEMMRLYKEHGVNPAGGCLPLLIQLPVFWGFFRMLTVAVEFRKAPFALWIRDLSVHDPYYVTPILMGVTQYISQKMTPTSADPTQARMMLIMPVVMTVFFMNFQSGLVLYWLMNNVLQIAQQAIMNRMNERKKAKEAHGPHGKRR